MCQSKARIAQPERTASILINDVLVYGADKKESGPYKAINTLCSSIILDCITLTMGQRNGS